MLYITLHHTIIRMALSPIALEAQERITLLWGSHKYHSGDELITQFNKANNYPLGLVNYFAHGNEHV